MSLPKSGVPEWKRGPQGEGLFGWGKKSDKLLSMGKKNGNLH